MIEDDPASQKRVLLTIIARLRSAETLLPSIPTGPDRIARTLALYRASITQHVLGGHLTYDQGQELAEMVDEIGIEVEVQNQLPGLAIDEK